MILTLKGSKNMITFSYAEDCGKLTLRIKRARATRERTPEFFKHSLQEIQFNGRNTDEHYSSYNLLQNTDLSLHAYVSSRVGGVTA